MITFIVCSIREDHRSGLAENLAATVGVEYELLVHDNRETRWGLARVYNWLAARAQHPLLCFVHEDVRFLSPPGWGREIAAFYSAHPDAGAVGFAGSQVKTRTDSGWMNLTRYSRENLVQHSGSGRSRIKRRNPHGESFSRVTALDGFCLFAPRAVWLEHRFDEVTFPGFHLYDLDFSTQLASSHLNFVCHTVLAEHFSPGSFDEAWSEASDAYHRKWGAVLPIACVPLSPESLKRCEDYSAYRQLRDLLKRTGAGDARVEEAWRVYRAHATRLRDLKLLHGRFRAALRRFGSRSTWP